MLVRLPFTLILFGLFPLVAKGQSLNKSPDWKQSIYFCQVEKRVFESSSENSFTEPPLLFDFQMKVTRTTVSFDIDKYRKMDNPKFYGSYNEWNASGGRGTSHQAAFLDGQFIYSETFQWPRPWVSADFASCKEILMK